MRRKTRFVGRLGVRSGRNALRGRPGPLQPPILPINPQVRSAPLDSQHLGLPTKRFPGPILAPRSEFRLQGAAKSPT